MTKSAPTVSVIVPVRNRLDLLRLLFEAMVRQTFRDFEIVLIDDGSTEDVAGFAHGFALGGPGVCCVRTEGVGAAAARNRGASVARGRILAFTDSDCEPDATWLAEGVAAIDNGADVVQGVTVPARRVGLLERSISYRGGEGLFATCNVFYRREAYEESGGFNRVASFAWRYRSDDEDGSVRGEDGRDEGRDYQGPDVLLGWRVARRGVMRVAEKAIVKHAVTRPRLRELFSRAWQVRAFPALVREVPELRETLLRQRIFLQDRSRVPIYAMLVSALLGRGELAALAGGWWVGSVIDRVGRRFGEPYLDRAQGLPVELALDATKAAALLAGTVQTRTIVL